MKKPLDRTMRMATHRLCIGLDKYSELFTREERARIYRAMTDAMWNTIDEIERTRRP